MHDNQAWVRCSAQVWNELDDFEYVGRVLIKVTDQLRDGSWEGVRFD